MRIALAGLLSPCGATRERSTLRYAASSSRLRPWTTAPTQEDSSPSFHSGESSTIADRVFGGQVNPRATPSTPPRHAAVALGGIPRRQSGQLRLQPVLRTVPAVAPEAR